MNKIAVLYICTGKYSVFFDGFFNSSEAYFLPGMSKEYFVWTDSDLLGSGFNNVHIIHKTCGGFPADTLYRFEMFMQAEDNLRKFDFVFFFNANTLFLQPVGKEILPDETGLVAGRWPGRRERQHPMFYPYERNKRSTAYIPPRKPPYVYYTGGLNGGTAESYLKMVRTLSENVREDDRNGIVAFVNDESHLNRYLWEHPCKILGAEYATPEEFTYGKLKYEPKIIFRDKVRLDPYFNKGRDRTLVGRIRRGFNVLCRAISWYL